MSEYPRFTVLFDSLIGIYRVRMDQQSLIIIYYILSNILLFFTTRNRIPSGVVRSFSNYLYNTTV